MTRRLAECELALRASNQEVARLGSERLRLEEDQRLTQERLARVARATDEALYDWDLRSGHAWFNEAYLRQFGDPLIEPQVDLQAWMKRVHPHERERIQADLSAAMEGSANTWTAEYHHQRPDGNYACILDRMHIARDATGKAVRMTRAMLDLSERRRIEEALRASEEKFDQAFGLSPIMLTMTSLADGRLINVNQSLLDATGYAREDVLGRTPVEMGWWVHPEEHEHRLAVLRKQGQTRNQELAFRFKEGMVRTYLCSVGIIKIYGQSCVLTALVDITERKQAEEATRLANERFRIAEAASKGFIYDWNVTGNHIERSDGFTKVLGYDQADVPNTLAGWQALIHPGDFARIRALLNLPLKEQMHASLNEYRVRHKNGQWIWVLDENVVMRDADKVVRVVGSTVDITELKQTEEKLRSSEARQSFLLKLGDALRPLADPIVIEAEAARVLGEYLGASRVHYDEVEVDGAHVMVWQDYTDGVVSLSGRFRMSDFGPAMIAQLRTGRTLVTRDVPGNPDLSEAEQAAYAGVQVGAQICVPLIKNGRFVAILSVHQNHARPWTPDEVALVEETAERTWASIERARAEVALQSLNATLEARVTERTAELCESQAQLRKLSAYAERMREDERTRIAREVHDELGGSLTALKMTLARVRKGREGDADLSTRLTDMRDQIDELVQTVRRVASDLRPPLLDDFGLVAALKWQVEEWERRTGIACQLDLALNEAKLDRERRTAVFRVFQESLTNVARHAQATQVVMTIREDHGQLVLTIHDNGRGIDAEALRPGKSLGLLGIRERMREVGGDVEISGAPNQGTMVMVRVPLEPVPHDVPARPTQGLGLIS